MQGNLEPSLSPPIWQEGEPILNLKQAFGSRRAPCHWHNAPPIAPHRSTAARQMRRLGDPGSSKFYVSFEDALMRLFASPRITALPQRFRPPEGEPISAKVLNKSIETAQKRMEQRNYTIRKHTLEYDDVMNKQRKEIYAFRNEVLRNSSPLPLVKEILESVCGQMSLKFFVSKNVEGGWNAEGYRTWLMTHFPLTFENTDFDNDYLTLDELSHAASSRVVAACEQKIEHQASIIQKAQEMSAPRDEYPEPMAILQEVLRSLLTRNIDRLWQEHLLHIDHLRTEVHLRALGQKDPLLEFKHEAFALFDSFSLKLKLEIAHALFKFEMIVPEMPPQRREPLFNPEHLLHRTNLSLLPELETELN